LKISSVIPTCEAKWDAGITFRSLPELTCKPNEIIVVVDGDKEKVEDTNLGGVPVKIFQTRQRGAAAKRNLGVKKSSGEAILFVDDDVGLRPGCLEAMNLALTSDASIGGVGSFIENQLFQEPGRYSRIVYQLAGGWGIRDFSGRCFGPLINIYPRPWDGDGVFRKSEWLNTTCTMYRRNALPQPVFEAGFTGYSFMEDLALSRRVRKKWNIGMARDAWIVHHTRQAPYKEEAGRLLQMGVENKYHILREIEGWPAAQAALALTWLEILLLPAIFKDVMKHPNSLEKLAGIIQGLAKNWQRSLQKPAKRKSNES